MRVLAIALSLALVTEVTWADAQSTVETMKAFGLIGIWSRDCTKDIAKDSGSSRVTYEIDAAGLPSFTSIANYGSGTLTIIADIQSAEQMTSDKIKLVTVEREARQNPPRGALSFEKRPMQIIYEKVDDKIRVIENKSVDGAVTNVENGVTTRGNITMPLLGKCLR